MTISAPLHAAVDSSPGFALVGAALGIVLIGGAAVTWLVLGRGPRRRRAFQQAQRLLHEGHWQTALTIVKEAQAHGRLSPIWEGQLRNTEGECRRAAGEAALAEMRFEDALEHHLAAARLLSLPETDARQRIIEAMLAEVRRRFAATQASETPSILGLIDRLLRIESPNSEAQFWRGLCHIRQNEREDAIKWWRSAQEGAGKDFLDPPLYLGILLLREGRGPEALRQLAEANRLAPNCPFVSWQLGTAIAGAGNDPSLAVRALQRALGPNGLPRLAQKPERVWTDGLPGPERSFVQRLASQHPFHCPLMGGDAKRMLREANLALAHAHSRLGNDEEAVKTYDRLLQDAAPSLAVLRGLGLSLARLKRYDEAFKHLRAAHELEEPKDPTTAGYLALCAARGKPSRPEDRDKNVLWAIRLLGRFNVYGDAEWAAINGQVFAEAQALGLAPAAEDQLRLCDVLASVDACDASAAAAFDQLAVTSLEAIQPKHALLYCRAALLHGYRGQRDTEFFTRGFTDVAAARTYFEEHSEDFEEVEYLFLERWAERQPGRFPDVLGPDYPARGQALLLARAEHKEMAGDGASARAAVAVLHKLAPHSPQAHDRLAELSFRQGDLDRAARLLDEWHALEPDNPLPLLRRAVLEQQRGDGEESRRSLNRALERAPGKTRSAIAGLGARLALAGGQPAEAVALLKACLTDNARDANARWRLAALLWDSGDREALATQASEMQHTEADDPRFHYLAAVCHWAAGDAAAARASAERAATDPRLAAESHYLVGLTRLRDNDVESAIAAFKRTAVTPDAPSRDYARSHLGRLYFDAEAYGEAVRWWSSIDPQKRSAWKLDEALRGAGFLAGLVAFDEGKYEQAAERFREVGRLGLRDRRLGALLILALFKAGQQLIYWDHELEMQNGTSMDEAQHVVESPVVHPAAAEVVQQ